MRPLRTILLALAWVVAVPLLAQAQTPVATGSGITIEGQVSHDDTGEPAPASLPLMLHTYEGRSMTGMTDGVTDEKGRFRFTNVETAPGRSFEVMVRYNDVTYFSELVEPAATQTRLELPVTIRETTTDTAALRVEQLVILLDFTAGKVNISQVFVLSNDGDRTVLSREHEGLRFRLPSGAADISFEGNRDPSRLLQEPDGFLDKGPVTPGRGTHYSAVRYSMPYQDSLDLDVPLDYPTASVGLLLPEVGVEPGGSDWEAGEESLVQKQVYQSYRYRLVPRAAGQVLKVAVSGKPEVVTAAPEPKPAPAATPVGDNRQQVLLGGLALAAVLMIAAGIWWWREKEEEGDLPFDLPPHGEDPEPEGLDPALKQVAIPTGAYEAEGGDEAEGRE